MSKVTDSIEEERLELLAQLKRLELALRRARKQEAKLKDELVTVNAQVAYYEGLTRDMKKDTSPPRLRGLLRHMR